MYCVLQTLQLYSIFFYFVSFEKYFDRNDEDMVETFKQQNKTITADFKVLIIDIFQQLKIIIKFIFVMHIYTQIRLKKLKT